MAIYRRALIGASFLSLTCLAPSASAQIRADPNAAKTADFGVLFAQDVPPGGPAPRGADGHPDLTGFWKGIKEPGKPVGNLGRDEPGHLLPLTPEGLKVQTYLRTKTIDPEALCILGGIPRHNASALPFEILHTPKRLAFLYLYTTHRVIPIDGRAKEADPDPGYFGNPVGSWDGDTFVIETTGLKDSADGKVWGDENADPVSAQTHVVERWTRPDFDHIHLEMTVSDPKYYTHDLHYARTWVLARDRSEGLAEYACSENNIDAAHLGPGPGAINPDGTRGYSDPVLPKDPPGPEAYELKDPAPHAPRR